MSNNPLEDIGHSYYDICDEYDPDMEDMRGWAAYRWLMDFLVKMDILDED